jgi:hypothetical protein
MAGMIARMIRHGEKNSCKTRQIRKGRTKGVTNGVKVIIKRCSKATSTCWKGWELEVHRNFGQVIFA